MKIFNDTKDLRGFTAQAKEGGKKIALVPTMGALHDGHISLIRDAKRNADIVIASIFVNPLQFNVKQDLEKYPRNLDGDIKKLQKSGCNVLWAPSVDTMYPQDCSTTIKAGDAANGMEGAARNGHFDGVVTVVAKLFGQTQPDIAVFGEKDWQQLCVIRQMTRDLNMPIDIIGARICRDEFGLALSSRNERLSPCEIKTARKLNVILRDAKNHKNIDKAKIDILDAGFDKVDYVEIHDGRILAAAWIGDVRLIDNL